MLRDTIPATADCVEAAHEFRRFSRSAAVEPPRRPDAARSTARRARHSAGSAVRRLPHRERNGGGNRVTRPQETHSVAVWMCSETANRSA
eukprot:ctg_1891.g638